MSTEIIYPTYVDYTIHNKIPFLDIYGRNENGDRVLKHVKGYNPYFFIPIDTKVPKDTRILRVETDFIEDGVTKHFVSVTGQRLKKLVVQSPLDISGRNEKYTYIKDYFDESYETDIRYTNRAIIDLKLNNPVVVPTKDNIKIDDISPYKSDIVIPLRMMIMDLENNDTGTIDDAKEGLAEIYCLCIWDSRTDTYHIFSYLNLTKFDKLKVKSILKGHWKDSKYEYMIDSKIQFHTDTNSEIEMLNEVNTFIRQNYPDVYAGWNFEDYDVPVYVHRCEKLNINPAILSESGKVHDNKYGVSVSGLLTIDLMGLYDKLAEKTLRFTNLNHISNIELGTKKLPRVSIKEMSQTNVAHLLAYNIIDVQLTKLIEEKMHLIDFFKMIATKAFSRLGVTFNSQLIDSLILDYVKGRFVLPTQKTKEEIEEEDVEEDDDFVGGMVYESKAGIHKNIVVLDYSGLYPSIMRSLNISIETKDPNGEIKAANGIRFKKSPRGIVPEILESLLEERIYYKKLEKQAIADGDKMMELVYHLKQIAVKILMNAFFGVLGFKSFRLNDIDTASAITTTGQFISMSTKDFVEKTFGYEVIYGDTDSLFLHIPEANGDPIKAKEIAEKLCNEIHVFLDKLAKEYFNIDTHYFSIEFDKYFSVLMQVNKKTGEGAKKRYAGYQYDYGFNKFEFTAKGFELKRASSSTLTQETQIELIKMVLDENPRSKIIDYLNKINTDLHNGNIEQTKLSLRYNIKKPIVDFELERNKHLRKNTKYMSVSKGYKGTLNANKHLYRRFGKGDTLMLYFVNETPKDIPLFNELCLEFDEKIPTGFKLDYDECWENFIKRPMTPIINVYNMDWSMLEDKSENKSIFAYNKDSSENDLKEFLHEKKTTKLNPDKLTDVDINQFERKKTIKVEKKEFNLFSFGDNS
jgi:DNA polymerase I